MLTAGELNNEMLFAERIEDEAYRDGGHIGFITTYVNSKLSASQYDLTGPFGDVGNTVLNYQAMGFDIDQDRIDSASRTSFFLSGLSYQLIYQTVRMFTGASIRFTAWEPGGVQLPNTSFFMTRSGLSYRVRTGYRTGSWRFPLAVERVFEGDKRTEVSIGAERGLERMHLRARATVGEGIGVALGADYRIRERIDLRLDTRSTTAATSWASGSSLAWSTGRSTMTSSCVSRLHTDLFEELRQVVPDN